jgi:hypothetical protein
MRANVILPVASFVVSVSFAAAAQNTSINAPPQGAGTPTNPPGSPAESLGKPGRTTTGVQVEGLVGTGFSSTYELALGGRVGYAMDNGVYVGGGGSYGFGHSVETPTASDSAYAWELGGELGYILYPFAERSVAIRPFVFAGPGFVKQVEARPFTVQRSLGFAIEPGVLGAYHFGHGFVSAEARYHITPGPGTVALLLGGGVAF